MGELVQWDKSLSHGWLQVGYPCALLTFEAQRNLSRFLRTAVELLLTNDLENAAKGNDNWHKLVSTGFTGVQGSIPNPLYIERAFSAPPSFEPTYIAELCGSKYANAEDDLVQLQSQPRYVRYLLDELNNTMAHMTPKYETRAINLNCLAARSVMRYTAWAFITSEADMLVEHRSEDHAKLQKDSLLPARYDMALLRFEAAAMKAFQMTTFTLLYILQDLSAFQEHWDFSADSPTRSTSSENDFQKDRLFWHLMELADFEYGRTRSASFHLDQIQSLLAQHPRERERVNQPLLDRISDLSAMDEVITAVRYLRGRSRAVGYTADHTFVCLGMVSFVEAMQLNCSVARGVYGMKKDSELDKAANAFQSARLTSKKMSEQWVERTRALYLTLSDYWTLVAAQTMKHMENFAKAPSPSLQMLISMMRLTEGQEYKDSLEVCLKGVRHRLEERGKSYLYSAVVTN
jgi:hypothetical protein